MIAQVRPIRHHLSGVAPFSRHLWGIVVSGSETGDADGPTTPRVSGRASRPPRLERRRARPALFRQTLERASRLISPRRLVAVVAREEAARYRTELADIPEVDRVVQPTYRGSAPEVFLPLLKIDALDKHAVVVVLPSGHLIDYEARFMNYVAKAVAAVGLRPDLPVVIGARPLTPDPVSTWIEPGEPIDGLESLAVRSVKRFVHQPSLAEVEALYEGDGLLNTLVLISTARTLLDLGRLYLPDVLETLEPLETAFGGPEETLLCEAVYEGMPYASISRQLLERGRDFAVLPIPEVLWSDLARPAALAALAS